MRKLWKRTISAIVSAVVTFTAMPIQGVPIPAIHVVNLSADTCVLSMAEDTNNDFISGAFNLDANSKVYDGTDTEQFIQVNGNKYYHGVMLGTSSSHVSFNVENVKTISFSFGHVDNTALNDAKFEIYLDNELYESVDAKANGITQKKEIDVSKASTIRFKINGYYTTSFAVMDLMADGKKPEHTCKVPVYGSNEEFVKSAWISSPLANFHRAIHRKEKKIYWECMISGIMI